MTENRVFTDPRPQSKKADGSVNTNGKLFFREPGSNTTTLKSVYSDKALQIAYTNPVILDDEGRIPTIYLNGDYNVQMTDSNESQLWRVDNYQPSVSGEQYSAWDASITYSANDIVRYTDGEYYVSLQSSNLGRTPSATSTYWSQTYLFVVYNSSQEYQTGDVVYYNGALWASYNGPHTGVTPGTDSTRWRLQGNAPQKSGFIDLSFMYLDGGTGATITYDVSTNVTESTYESIGPSGSGADNEWSTLPSIPSTAKALIISTSILVIKNTGADERFSLACQFRQTGDDRVYLGASGRNYGGATAGEAQASSRMNVIVPLDSNLRFDAFWSTLGSPDTSTVDIYYVGYLE